MATTAKSVTAATDARRELMLRAALEVIAERGFPETRIGDVAERAGASPALVIYYFRTKDALLTEAMRYAEDRFYELGATRTASVADAKKRLEVVVRMCCLDDPADDPPDYWVLWLDLWAQAVRHPEVAKVRQEFDDRWRESISAIVTNGQSTGEFGPVDADDFADGFSALLDGLAVQMALGDRRVDGGRAFRLAMKHAAGALGFDWSAARDR